MSLCLELSSVVQRRSSARAPGLPHLAQQQTHAADMRPAARPQGHMRLLLLPVLYNAMAQSEDPRHHVLSPLFQALHAAIHASTYSPLVAATAQGMCLSAFPAQQQEPVFHGPHNPLQCLAKYTLEDQPPSKPKRKRSKGSPAPAAEAAVAAPPEASDAAVRDAGLMVAVWVNLLVLYTSRSLAGGLGSPFVTVHFMVDLHLYQGGLLCPTV